MSKKDITNDFYRIKNETCLKLKKEEEKTFLFKFKNIYNLIISVSLLLFIILFSSIVIFHLVNSFK